MKNLSDEKLNEVMSQAASNLSSAEKKESFYDIESIIKLGRLEQTIDVVPGMAVTMHALCDSERVEAMRFIQDDILDMSFTEKMERMKKPVLTYAITKINEMEFVTKEQKDKLFDALGKMSTPLVDLINLKYTEMYANQIQMVTEGLKKK